MVLPEGKLVLCFKHVDPTEISRECTVVLDVSSREYDGESIHQYYGHTPPNHLFFSSYNNATATNATLASG